MTAQTAAAINILICKPLHFHLRVAMPVNVVEADKQTAQTERNQPNRVKRRFAHRSLPATAHRHANRASQHSEAAAPSP